MTCSDHLCMWTTPLVAVVFSPFRWFIRRVRSTTAQNSKCSRISWVGFRAFSDSIFSCMFSPGAMWCLQLPALGLSFLASSEVLNNLRWTSGARLFWVTYGNVRHGTQNQHWTRTRPPQEMPQGCPLASASNRQAYGFGRMVVYRTLKVTLIRITTGRVVVVYRAFALQGTTFSRVCQSVGILVCYSALCCSVRKHANWSKSLAIRACANAHSPAHADRIRVPYYRQSIQRRPQAYVRCFHLALQCRS